MATVKSIFICPRCDAGITAIGSETSCPECGLHLGGKTGIQSFQPPLTLDEQNLKLANKELHVQAILALPLEKSLSMLQDALNIIELVGSAKHDLQGIRSIVNIAMQIGNVGKSYDDFIQAGGRHVPSILLRYDEERKERAVLPPISSLPSSPQEKSNEQSTNTTGGETR